MKKLYRWLRGVPRVLLSLGQMLELAWRADRLSFLILMALQCLQGLVPLASAWITKVLFDLLAQTLHGAPGSLQNFFLLLAAQGCIALLSELLIPVNQYFNARLGRTLMLHLRTTIYKKITSIRGLAYFEDPTLHDTIQMAANNAQLGPLQSLTIFTTLLQGAMTLLSFLGVLLTLNPLLTAIVGFAVIPQLLAQLKLGNQRFFTVLNNTPNERRASYYGQVLSWVTHAKEVRLFNLGEYFLQKFVATTREIHRVQERQQRRELRWQIVLSLLASAISTGAFACVILQALSGRLSLGDVALYTSAVTSTLGALAAIVGASSRMYDSFLFFRQYIKLLALEEPLLLSSAPRMVPPLKSGITLRNISFRYSQQHPWILRHVDLSIPARRCLALVGLNGAGKTTLVKLLMRLYDPIEGQILWDGIDIREFDPQELRQHMGAIFQDFSRYDLTVQENIGLGDVAQIEDEARVQVAAQKAGIHEHIEALPQGYQSVLSRWLAEKSVGVDLSGGEWQKLALARMFMHDADMLILDEPTAALDAQAEYELYHYFRQLMQERTCILITHRFSTVRMADHIAVLEDGQVVEYGMHDDLLAHEGSYAKMYSMQAESYQ